MKMFNIILLFTVVLFLGTVYFLWINSAGAKSIQHLMKLLSLLLAAIALIGVDLLDKKEIKVKANVLMLQFENQDLSSVIYNGLTSNVSEHKSGYESIQLISGLRRDSIVNNNLSLDLVELGLIRWLSINFPYPSYEKAFVSHTIQGNSGIGYTTPSQKESVKIEQNQIISNLKSNIFLKNNKLPQPFYLYLPIRTSFSSISHSDKKRTLSMKNDFLTFTITMKYMGGGSAQISTIPYKSISRQLPGDNNTLYYSNEIEVKFECDFSRWNKGNKESIRQQKWIENIVGRFESDFDWSNIKQDLIN